MDSQQPGAERPIHTDLQRALAQGDPEVVRALIDTGADIRYRREDGYDALIDAVHGRDISRDQRLLDLLSLLIKSGVELSGISRYSESGLRVLSRLGRFDAVKLLLDAGADKRHLEWSDLMHAVALGTLADVKAAIDAGANLEARDRWSRTAWLIALLTGDIAKARLLLEHGADTTACGHCDIPPLFYPIHGHHPHMVRWLIDVVGVDVHQTDQFGHTALMEAAEEGDLECLEMLLAAGADPEGHGDESPLKKSTTREVAMRLLSAGADPADVNQRLILRLPEAGGGTDRVPDYLGEVSRDGLGLSLGRTFGSSNPELMNVPFWIAMIRAGVSAYEARTRFDITKDSDREPVWSAQRFGQSLTLLPDGRAIQIGGEHEDFYDSDFCIYNDVFVHHPSGSISIYGYPEDVFPPTDFHTATLVGDVICIIGSLGYMGAREFSVTPVYVLDTRTMSIKRLLTTGIAPGWIYKHRARPQGNNSIRVWGGKLVTKQGEKERHDTNPNTFLLDLQTLIWSVEIDD